MIPQSRLKPQANGSNRPPIFLRLTPKALEGIVKRQALKLEVQGATARLVVGDLELSGTLQPDPGSFEVFTKESGAYRSQGQVEKRLVLREAVANASGAASAATSAATSSSGSASGSTTSSSGSAGSSSTSLSTRRKSPSPKHRPLVHVAALGAITPAALGRNCNVPTEEAREFLISFATPVDSKRIGAGDPFILNDEAYLYVRPWEYSYSLEDRKLAIENCKAALDRMEIGPEHTARKSLKKPKAVATAAAPPPSAAVVAASAEKKKRKETKEPARKEPLRRDKELPKKEATFKRDPTPPKKEAQAKREVKDLKKEPIKKKSPPPKSPSGSSKPDSSKGEHLKVPSGASGASGAAGSTRTRSLSPQKRPASAPLQSPRKRPSLPEDLSKVADKFHKTYSNYADLYRSLESTPERGRDAAQVKRLLAMHRDLAEWKSLLWSSVDSKN